MARTEYLLTSEDFIKSCTNISDNLSGKYLQGAIRDYTKVIDEYPNSPTPPSRMSP